MIHAHVHVVALSRMSRVIQHTDWDNHHTYWTVLLELCVVNVHKRPVNIHRVSYYSKLRFIAQTGTVKSVHRWILVLSEGRKRTC